VTKKCPKCGAINLNDVIRCDGCGASLVLVPPEGAKTAEVCLSCGASSPLGATRCSACGKDLAEAKAAVRKRERRWLYVSVSIIVIALLVFALFVPYNHATLEVTVVSTQGTETVHYHLYVNGVQRGEGDMAPNNETIWTLEVGWSNTGSNVMTVSTSSTGGAAPVQDNKTIAVDVGGFYRIDLNV
jgi:ribosomal protein L40E